MENTNNKKYAAFLINRPYVDAVAALNEPIKFLAAHGWNVDLYTRIFETHGEPFFESKNVRVIVVDYTKLGTFKMLANILLHQPKYDCLFAVPQTDLYYGSIAANFLKIPTVVISDELWKTEDADTAQKKKWKAREISSHKKAMATIALTGERADFVRTQNQLEASHPIFVVANAPSGPSQRLKSDYYYQTLNISSTRPILLMAGALHTQTLKKFVEHAAEWKNSYTVVVHGRIKGIFEGFNQSENLRFHTQVLPSNQMPNAISSASIGIGLYEDTEGLGMMGLASSKLGSYLKNGLPVIFSNQALFKFIETQGLGVCVNTIDEIPSAADKIMESYDQFSKNVKSFFDNNLDFNKNFKPFFEKLESVV